MSDELCPKCQHLVKYHSKITAGCNVLLSSKPNIWCTCSETQEIIALRKLLEEYNISSNDLLDAYHTTLNDAIRCAKERDALRHQLDDVVKVAMDILNKLDEFEYTESGISWEIKSAKTAIKRIMKDGEK